MKNKHFTILFIIVFISNVLVVKAQNKADSLVTKLNFIGFGGGSSHYYGDLAPYRYFKYGLYTNVRWNGTINYTHYISPQKSIRVSFTYARILGDDNTFAARNLDYMYRNYLRNSHFRNDIKEFTLTGIYNLLPQNKKRPIRFMPYAFAGIGIIGHNPQAKAPTKLGTKAWTYLKQFNTSGQLTQSGPKPYPLVQPILPIGLGVKIKINERFNFMVEVGARLTHTQYLDDVGNVNYADPSSLLVPYSKDFANRAGEDIAARTGNNRVADFQNIMVKYFGLPNASWIKPSENALAFVGYGTQVENRGSTRLADSYLVTQFTINYALQKR